MGRKLRRIVLISAGVLTLITFTLIFAYYEGLIEESYKEFLVGMPSIVGLLFVLVYGIIIIVKKIDLLETNSNVPHITITPDSIIVREVFNKPITINYYAIVRVEEDADAGLFIFSSEYTKPVFILRESSGYNRLKSHLAKLSSITFVAAASSPSRMVVIPLVSYILLFASLVFLFIGNDWKYLSLALFMQPLAIWVMYMLISGRCGRRVTRRSNPFVYWFSVVTWSSFLVAVFLFIDYSDLLTLQLAVKLSLATLAILWVLAVLYMAKRYWVKE